MSPSRPSGQQFGALAGQARGRRGRLRLSRWPARVPQSVVVGLVLSLLLVGCAAPSQVAQTEVEQKWLTYLKDGKTTKEEVLLRLGLPAAQFEGDRILTYRLMLSDAEGLVVVARELDSYDPRVAHWARGQYSLVLVFDGKHILQRHTLLRVR